MYIAYLVFDGNNLTFIAADASRAKVAQQLIRYFYETFHTDKSSFFCKTELTEFEQIYTDVMREGYNPTREDISYFNIGVSWKIVKTVY